MFFDVWRPTERNWPVDRNGHTPRLRAAKRQFLLTIEPISPLETPQDALIGGGPPNRMLHDYHAT
jgi:hypothetical protein